MRERHSSGVPLTVVVLDDFHDTANNSPAIRRLERDELIRVKVHRDSVTGQALQARVAEADILIPIRERSHLTAEVLRAAGHLRLIAQTGTGTAHIDRDAAAEFGVEIMVTAGASTDAVAELCLGLLLSLHRGIASSHGSIRAGGWPLSLGREMKGSSLGLVGFGKIPKALSRLVVPLGVRVHAWVRRDYPPYPDVEFHSDLDAMLADCESVSLHLPLTPATVDFFGAERFAAMRDRSFFVNASRGAIVDERALAAALSSGHLAGAGLDVFGTEPLPLQSPLRGLDNLLMTPHSGWQTEQTYERFYEGCVENIFTYLVTSGTREDPRATDGKGQASC